LILETENVLGRAIDELAVARTSHNPTTLDLLIRLSLAPNRQLRGVDLCRQLLKSPGYVSRVIDQAETDGLVVRRADPDDRRAQRVALTKVGEDALDVFIPHVLEVLDQTVYAALDDTEIETLIDLLSRVAASAHQFLEQHDRVSA
jgi:DNA-binding MarR family transcriptional regulator